MSGREANKDVFVNLLLLHVYSMMLFFWRARRLVLPPRGKFKFGRPHFARSQSNRNLAIATNAEEDLIVLMISLKPCNNHILMG